MNINLLAAAAIALAAFSVAADASEDCGGVSTDGFCRVGFGMTLSEAVAAQPALSGVDDVNFEDPEEAGCFYLQLAGSDGDAWLMFTEGAFSRVDFFEPGIATTEGAEVGMTLAQIEAIYPQGKRRPNHYNEMTDDMIVALGGGMLAVFEAYEDDVVHSYRVGYAKEAQYVEGCS